MFENAAPVVQEMMLAGGHPTSWDEYKGQPQATAMLRRAALSARLRGDTLKHVLIEAPVPGIGKTSLALLVAAELGVNAVVISGALSQQEVIQRLAFMADGDVLIVDEAHQMFMGGKAKGEFMLHLMQHGSVVDARGVAQPLPDVTYIFATTEKRALPLAILDRFTYTPELVEYDIAAGADIAEVIGRKAFAAADIESVMFGRKTAEAIAAAGSSRPRQMARIIDALIDFLLTGGVEETPDHEYDLTAVLADVRVTSDGLTDDALTYMRALASSTRPLGKAQVAEMTNLGGVSYSEVETMLVKKEYVEFTKSGRALTIAGMRRAHALGLLVVPHAA